MDVINETFVFAERRADGSVQVTKGSKDKRFLDPEIANEGQYAGKKVILSDGEQVTWTPPPVKPVMPDWSTIPSLRKYFFKEGRETWPCWFYHPSEKERLIKDAEEAYGLFGVQRRKATDRERALQGAGEWVWDSADDCLWQPAPYAQNMPKQDLGNGKNLIVTPPDPQIAQHALIKELVGAMQGGQNQFLIDLLTAMKGAPAAPAEPSHEVQHAAASAEVLSTPPVDHEKAEWIAKAEEAGVKIDRRWSAEKIRNHVMTELERRLAAAEAGATEGAELASELREGDLLPGAIGEPLGR